MKPKVTKGYQKLLIQSAQQKVLAVLYQHPEKEFSLSDLAKMAGVAKPHIGKTLQELVILEMITIVKLSKIWRIKANQQSWIFLKNKILFNLNFIYQSGLVEFLNEYFGNPKAVILFGSFRWGEDLSTSDIDIAIEIEETKEYTTIGLRELINFEEMISRKIQLHLFNRKNVDIDTFNGIANGIVLIGFLEVKP